MTMAIGGLTAIYNAALGIVTAAAPYAGAAAGSAAAYGGQFLASKMGQAWTAGAGAQLGKNMVNYTGSYIPGGGGAMGGCSCKAKKPQYSCQEKCAYKEYMSQKCTGCTAKYSKKKKSSSYGGYSYGGYPSSGYRGPMTRKYGYTKKTTGRKYALPRKNARLAARDAKKSVKYPKIQRRKDVGGPKWGKRR